MAGDNLSMGCLSFNRVRSVMLVGHTGYGKSATGNSILQRKAFKAKLSATGVTRVAEIERTCLETGQLLAVIDTPGLFDASLSRDFVEEQMAKCLQFVKDGLDAILVVLSAAARISVEQADCLVRILDYFGKKIEDYGILIITGGDELEEEGITLDEFIDRSSDDTKEILNMFGGRMVLFDNRTDDKRKNAEQVEQLLSLMYNILTANGGWPFTEEDLLQQRAIKVSGQRLPEHVMQAALLLLFVLLLKEALKKEHT